MIDTQPISSKGAGMQKVFSLVLVVFMVSMLSGCARDNSQQIAMLRAYNAALKNCDDKPGCLAATQASFYSGAYNQQEDTGVALLAAGVPYFRMLLDFYGIYKGATGSGGGSFFVKGSNNQFIGFNQASADRSSSISAPFDVTATPSTTESWSDLYNQENIRSQNQ